MRLIMQSVATPDPRPTATSRVRARTKTVDRSSVIFQNRLARPATCSVARRPPPRATATGQASATASSTRDRVLCHSTSTQGALSHEPSSSRCGGTTSQLDTAQRCAHPGTATAPDTQRTAAHRGGSGAALPRTVSFIREWEGNSRKLLPDYQAC